MTTAATHPAILPDTNTAADAFVITIPRRIALLLAMILVAATSSLLTALVLANHAKPEQQPRRGASHIIHTPAAPAPGTYRLI